MNTFQYVSFVCAIWDCISRACKESIDHNTIMINIINNDEFINFYIRRIYKTDTMILLTYFVLGNNTNIL